MNEEKSFSKTSINWFPGHMVKAKKEIKDNLKLVDVVIEIVDARIPISSRNPDFEELIGDKPRVIGLNKFDLADSSVNKLWGEFYKKSGVPAVLLNSVTGVGIKDLLSKARDLVQDKLDKSSERGRIGRSVKVAVIGIPNAGKSSFINKVAKRNAANVGNKPGVTRTKQWIRTDMGVELMDTPGILWPKFESEEVGLNLAFTGAIRYEILDNAELALKLVGRLREAYKEELCSRYKLGDIDGKSDLEVLEMIGNKRGCKISGGEIDYTKTANIVIDEFRKAIIGNISLERPGEI
jgi:ribosome biogenesis GTPase A